MLQRFQFIFDLLLKRFYLETFNVPVDTLEAFKVVNEAREPEKVAAETDGIEQLVPVKFPVHDPPAISKNMIKLMRKLYHYDILQNISNS